MVVAVDADVVMWLVGGSLNVYYRGNRELQVIVGIIKGEGVGFGSCQGWCLEVNSVVVPT